MEPGKTSLTAVQSETYVRMIHTYIHTFIPWSPAKAWLHAAQSETYIYTYTQTHNNTYHGAWQNKPDCSTIRNICTYDTYLHTYTHSYHGARQKHGCLQLNPKHTYIRTHKHTYIPWSLAEARLAAVNPK